jgi:hypothetical protein
MDSNDGPTTRTVLPISLILAVPGWIWLIYLVTQTLPDLGSRWMFFAAVMIALTGSSIPIIAYLNRIIKLFGPATYEIVVREGILVGLYAGILLWLNKGQILNFGVALILAVGIFLVEVLLRIRNRSQWRPNL